MSGGFDHRAFLYADGREFVEGTACFVTEGRALGAPVLVVLDAPKLEALRSALGPLAADVEFADMSVVGANPARIIPAWRDFVDAHASSRTLYGIGEPISPERGPDEMVECHRHEALLNLAFADEQDFKLLCPYDISALDPRVVADARRTHPVIEQGSSAHESKTFCGHGHIADAFADPLTPPPAEAFSIAYEQGDLRVLRARVADEAATAGLGVSRRNDIVLAVSEIATNAVRHGHGRGRARIWATEQTLLCEFEGGNAIKDPLVGRRRPPRSDEGGYGVWIANQLCDLVQIRNTPRGALVRLHMSLGAR